MNELEQKLKEYRDAVLALPDEMDQGIHQIHEDFLMVITPTPGQIWYHSKSPTAPVVDVVRVADSYVEFTTRSDNRRWFVPESFFISAYKPMVNPKTNEVEMKHDEQ